MRILSILAFLTLGLFTQVLAQVDIANARANPKTFIFDDDKHTVHGYIYNTLGEKTSCCGNDAIYLEVKFDQTGTVTSAKTLTGKNDCFKKSIVEIVQNVKWDATGVTGTKTIYFEVKPIIACSGSPGENVYKPLGQGSVVASVKEGSNTVGGNSGNQTVDVAVDEPVKTEPVKTEPVKTEPVKTEPVKTDVAGGDEEFLSEDEPVKPTKETVKETVADNSGKEAIKETAPVKSGKETIKETVPAVVKTEPVKPAPVASTVKPKPGGPIKLPPQEKIEYVSRGDVKPDASHAETHVNVQPTAGEGAKYADEGTFAVNLRTALRKSGFCGLAHATVELETDPRTGQVVNSRVLATNDPKVAELVPGVIKDLRFRPLTGASNRYVYTEFKTEITCNGEKPKYNLDQVDDFLVKPTAGN